MVIDNIRSNGIIFKPSEIKTLKQVVLFDNISVQNTINLDYALLNIYENAQIFINNSIFKLNFGFKKGSVLRGDY